MHVTEMIYASSFSTFSTIQTKYKLQYIIQLPSLPFTYNILTKLQQYFIIIHTMDIIQQTHQDYNLSEQEKKCIDTISSFQMFYNFKNHESLVMIFLSKPLSLAFFNSNKVEISTLFGADQKEEQEENRIKHFAKKYSFERLCEKFMYPKGTITVFKKIIRFKLRKQYIQSHNTRKNVWLLASGAKQCMKMYKGMYKALLQMDQYPESYFRPIELDITRTVAKESIETMNSLKNILIAFSKKNPFIGYCQGLNFIAYFLISMQFSEEEAFWLLCQLIQTIIPMDYYTNMIGVVTDQRILLQIIRQHIPKIDKKFKEVQLDPTVFTIEWLVCLCTSTVPFYLVQIIWDRLIIQGTSALLKTVIIVIEQFEQQIMKAQDFPQIIQIIEQGSKKLSLSEDQFNLKYESIYVNRKILQLARDMYRELYIKEKLAERVGKAVNKNITREIKCNREWPICLQVLEKNKKQRQDCYAWIFKRSATVKINPNYLDTFKEEKPFMLAANNSGSFAQTNRTTSLNKQKHVDDKEWLIGRIEHICPAVVRPQTQTIHLQKQVQFQKSLSKSMVKLDSIEEQEEDILTFSFLQKKQITDKAAQRLKRAQSVFFFQKFINNNKQLGQIIANQSIERQP